MDLPAAHASLVAALSRLRNGDGGWPYYAGRKSRLEPTCWALLATGVAVETTPLSQWMNPAGLLAEPSTGQTNYAFNGLAALALSASSTDSPTSQRIVAALSDRRSERIPPSPNTRQDNTLQGWPWSDGTFSWIEPTAWCLLATKRFRTISLPLSPRISSAEALLRDRVCPGGGWNYGNAEVYGQGLPAHVPTTALALMALQDRTVEPIVRESASLLERQAPIEGSTTALALSILALATIGRPAPTLAQLLAARHGESETFGNAAAIGMAVHALDCSIRSTPSSAFTLSRRAS